MKVFVYLMVFCLLFFLLVLSFDESRTAQSEWDEASSTFVMDLSGDNQRSIENGTQMRTANQIAVAQQQGTTVWGLMSSSFSSMITTWKNKIADIFSFIALKTKETAFFVASDISELIYPTKQATNPTEVRSKSMAQQLSANRLTTSVSNGATGQSQGTKTPQTSDKMVPLPNTLVEHQSLIKK